MKKNHYHESPIYEEIYSQIETTIKKMQGLEPEISRFREFKTADPRNQELHDKEIVRMHLEYLDLYGEVLKYYLLIHNHYKQLVVYAMTQLCEEGPEQDVYIRELGILQSYEEKLHQTINKSQRI